MRHRPTGDRLKELPLGQLIQKLVQMTLDRFDGLLQHKKHQPWEGQVSLTGKVLRPHTMPIQESGITQLSAQSTDQGNEVMRNVMNSRLHPQVNGGTSEYVQAKSRNDSMLQLIHLQWGSAVWSYADAFAEKARLPGALSALAALWFGPVGGFGGDDVADAVAGGRGHRRSSAG